MQSSTNANSSNIRTAAPFELSLCDQFATTLAGIYGEAVYHSNKSLSIHQKSDSNIAERMRMKNLEEQEMQVSKHRKIIKKLMSKKVKELVTQANERDTP
jgi:hypothetical protein